MLSLNCRWSDSRSSASRRSPSPLQPPTPTPARLASPTFCRKYDAVCTFSSYKRSWRLLLKFCEGHSFDREGPVSGSVIALFISHLQATGYTLATVSSNVSAIGNVHKVKSWIDPKANFFVQTLLLVCHKRTDKTSRCSLTSPCLAGC